MADLNPHALLTASQAAEYAGVTVAAVCNWVAAGRLSPATGANGLPLRDSRRRLLYRLIDVAEAERDAGQAPQSHRRPRAA